MIERRITYAKDKTEIIKRLQAGDDSTGPFGLIADVLVFAAALGLRRQRRRPVVEPLAEPIRQSVFDRQGYDTMMNLVALHTSRSSAVLADTDDAVNARAREFEELANGGLELLEEELRGAPNVLETIVLLITAERATTHDDSNVFELSKLIG